MKRLRSSMQQSLIGLSYQVIGKRPLI